MGNLVEKLQQLLADLASIDDKIDALLAGESLSEEQKKEHDQLVAQRAALEGKITSEQSRLRRQQQRQTLQDEVAGLASAHDRVASDRLAGSTRLTTPDQPSLVGRSAGRETIPAEYRRSRVQHFRGVVDGRDPNERAYRFGMWALSQLSRQMPGRYQFREALDFFNRQEWAVVHQTNNATGGHYLVPEEFSTDLILLREEYGVARRVLNPIPMTGETLMLPRQRTGLTAYWTGESQPTTESNATWDEIRITVKPLTAMARLSRQLDLYSVIDMGDRLAQEIAYAWTLKEDDALFNGDGTSTYGGTVGIRNRLDDCDGAGTDSFGLKTGSGSAWTNLALGDFQATVGKLPQYADDPEVAWVVHRTFFYEVMNKLELAAGGVTSMEIQKSERRQRPLFLGYPVEFSQVMPRVTASAQVCALLGSFNLAAKMGHNPSMDDISFSQDATVAGESVFERYQIAVRGCEMVDLVVHDYGDATNAGPVVGLKTA
jgi:HK97 family phage major capsid protein